MEVSRERLLTEEARRLLMEAEGQRILEMNAAEENLSGSPRTTSLPSCGSWR
jgi:hypothetical protein